MSPLRIIDTPILKGRTPRECLLIALCSGLLAWTVVQPRPYWLNAGLYALALACALTRFFASRGLGMGIAISACVQWWSRLQLPHVTVEMLPAQAWLAPALILVLASSDLEARYELAPSRIPFLRNPWVSLPRWDLRLMRWCMYALGSLAGALSLAQMRMHAGLDGWPLVTTGAIAIVLLLLALGKPLALFSAVPLGAFVLVETVPLLRGLDAALHGLARLPGWFAASPELVLPVVVTAALGWAICTAYAVLLVQRAVLSRKKPHAAVGAGGSTSTGVRPS